MVDTPLVCFCTEKTEEEVKEYIRKSMKPAEEVTNNLLHDVHKSFADEAIIGRCCGCMDEVEDLMVSYRQGRWR